VKRKIPLIAGVIVALAALSAGIAIAAGGGGEAPLTASTLEKATAAALDYTGGGAVTETEVGDEGAAYSVEIRLEDGTNVEVSIDGNFQVIGQAADDDGANEVDEAGEGEAGE
jgi:hypothetical protein